MDINSRVNYEKELWLELQNTEVTPGVNIKKVCDWWCQ